MLKDDSYWLNVGYVCLAALCGLLASYVLNEVAVQMSWTDTGWYLDYFKFLEAAIVIVVGVGSALFLRSREDWNSYFLSSVGEIRKVIWPSAEDTRKMTAIVCVVVAIFSVVLALFDGIWKSLLGLIFA